MKEGIEIHKKLAVDLFNKTWELMDNKKRTQEENDMMIHSAHASRFHWGEVVASGAPGTGPMNIERGEWQISRVYSVLDMAEPALYHASRCLDICKKNSIGDFDMAFAYEALARAHAIKGSKDEANKYLLLAKSAGDAIKEDGDRKYFFDELGTIRNE
jgi:hypothetical protein